MKKTARLVVLDDYMGCFGDFNREDEVCRKLCSLSILCIIERDQTIHMDFLDEMYSSNGTLLKIQ